MVGDGIKAARIQAQHSPLISGTWPGLAFQARVLSAVRQAKGRLNPHRPGRRPPGRHAAPGYPIFARRADLAAPHRFRKTAKSTRSTRTLATRSTL
jgi:hypothetical protein